MKKVKLGRTGIEVSRLGMGTGTAHPSGRCAQSLMDKKELADLLVYAFELGINFWDTAVTYDTHAHVKEALRHVPRSEVIISTKLNTFANKDTVKSFHSSLSELSTDYVDVCLVHGVRTGNELKRRRGALDAMLELKREGKIRAVGISSHGLSALEAVTEISEVDVIWARINYSGLCMDASELGLYDKLASITWLKNAVKKIVPKKIISNVRPQAETNLASEDDRASVNEILRILHLQSKGIVGMKILAEGQLGSEPEKALKYVNSLHYIDSFIIGMLNRDEIDENSGIVNQQENAD